MNHQRNGTSTLEKRKWDELSNDEKLDRLTEVLTRAGSDIEFRDRCLVSSASAKRAISEVAQIEFADDLTIHFLTEEERLKHLYLTLPDYIPPQDGVAERRDAEDYVPCTYEIWRG